jgi:hypothetical protein
VGRPSSPPFRARPHCASVALYLELHRSLPTITDDSPPYSAREAVVVCGTRPAVPCADMLNGRHTNTTALSSPAAEPREARSETLRGPATFEKRMCRLGVTGTCSSSVGTQLKALEAEIEAYLTSKGTSMRHFYLECLISSMFAPAGTLGE